MTTQQLSKDESIHITDEIINTSTHIFGTMLALLGMVLLIVKSSIIGDPWKIVSFSIYGTTLFLLFLASSLHHGINASKKTEELFRLFDYLAIFPLIAGTYTPLCLILLRNEIGWSVLGVIWAIAITGIVIKSSFKKFPKWAVNAIYIGLGWVGTVFVIPLYFQQGIEPIIYIAAGGIVYSIGFIVFNSEKPNFVPGKFGFHELWHILVLLAAVIHYLGMYFYVLPFKG